MLCQFCNQQEATIEFNIKKQKRSLCADCFRLRHSNWLRCDYIKNNKITNIFISRTLFSQWTQEKINDTIYHFMLDKTKAGKYVLAILNQGKDY